VEPNVATAAKPVKIPGPDHPITIERNPARIVVSVAGRVVGDTREALTLRDRNADCRSFQLEPQWRQQRSRSSWTS
jgi:uncharacterized protein (DUF427 family)